MGEQLVEEMKILKMNSVSTPYSFTKLVLSNTAQRTSEKIQLQKQNCNFTAPKRISAASYMTQIQSAKSSWGVANVVAKVRADARLIKSSGADESEVQKAVKIVNSVVEKGNMKMARLRSENRLKQQKASSRKMEKKRLDKELKRRQRVRKYIERQDTIDPRQAVLEKKQAGELDPLERKILERQLEEQESERPEERHSGETNTLDVTSDSSEMAVQDGCLLDVSI